MMPHLFLIFILSVSLFVRAEDFGCTGPSVVPLAAQGTGSYSGFDCFPPYGASNCQWAIGSWSIFGNRLVHLGVAFFAAGTVNASTSVTGNSLSGFCINSYTGDAATQSMELTMSSPLEDELDMCVTMTMNFNTGCALVTVGFSAGGLLPCTTRDNWTDVSLCDFAFSAPVDLTCPNAPNIVPSEFIQPLVGVVPYDELEPSMPRTAGLSSNGYYSTYMADILQEVMCALSFNIIEDDRAAQVTRWEILYGNSSAVVAGPVGCMTFVRLGRTVVFAERFVGNHDMDESCGGPATMSHDSLCCWNWTYSLNPSADGSSIKVLPNYFPPGWAPRGGGGGGGSTSAGSLSVPGIVAIITSVLLFGTCVFTLRLYLIQLQVMRVKKVEAEKESGVRLGLLNENTKNIINNATIDMDGGGGSSSSTAGQAAVAGGIQ